LTAGALLGYTFAYAGLWSVALTRREFLVRAEQAEHMLAETQRAREAETHAAALAERARIARDIHDVLAHSLAAVSVNIPFLTVIILGCFLFWSLPSMIANTFMPIRSFFAWSFDRLMPEKLADVNDRTHSPVIAIVTVNVIIAALVIWSVTSNVFQLVLGLIVLAGCLGVVIIAIAAIALPLRRPELYRASPANVKFLGIPVLFIVAPLSIAIFVALAVVSTQYPALVMQGNSANFWWIPAWFAGLIVAGSLLYYIPRYIRARRGINVSFVYKELPPE